MAYDQLGANLKAGQDFNPPPNWGEGYEFRGSYSDGDGADYSDFFESLFGQQFKQGNLLVSKRVLMHEGKLIMPK